MCRGWDGQRELEHAAKTTKKTVVINIKGAKGLMNVDGMMGASDPYCVLHILNNKEQNTAILTAILTAMFTPC